LDLLTLEDLMLQLEMFNPIIELKYLIAVMIDSRSSRDAEVRDCTEPSQSGGDEDCKAPRLATSQPQTITRVVCPWLWGIGLRHKVRWDCRDRRSDTPASLPILSTLDHI
jgi:hypothetical protein